MADQLSSGAAREGRGRGRGNSNRGTGAGRGRGRGGGGGNSGEGNAAGNRQQPKEQRGGKRGGGAGRGGISSPSVPAVVKNAEPANGKGVENKGKDDADDGDADEEVCFICASPIQHYSVGPCNHRTCHICALRMRALYKTRDCAHCRTPAPYVIFTDDATKRFEDFADAATTLPTDEGIGIRYESLEIEGDTRILLRYNCPDSDCDIACLSWPDLHRHVRVTHHKKICDLCSRHKKVFTHEHLMYTDKELNTHLTKGDDNPGAIDQSGFKGHPLCGFCKERFYGEDELFVHCREKHERCFLCDRAGQQAVYYLNYDNLENHFRLSHFLCPIQSCLDKKFTVFPTEIDLKAHQLAEHGDMLSKDVRRDARIVDISAFNYRDPYVEPRRAGGSQREQRERGRGRGRDPNAEPIPASTAQPLPRDQQAFQRQMAIQSAQTASARAFGGQLTPSLPAPRAQAPAGSSNPPSMSTNHSARVEATTAAVRQLDISQNLAPADQARALRHQSVIERATILLENDGSRLTQFRSLISSFKSSSITARNLIDSFFGLFAETSSTALGTLIREVADLYEDKSKADALRAAWNDWRAINEDYPSLPGPTASSTTFPGNWAGATGSSTSTSNSNSGPKTRVLKLKNSTAQSSRSPVSQTRSWGTASARASGPSSTSAATSNFPGLPSSSSSSSATQHTSRINTIPWTAPSSAPTSGPNSAPTSRPPSTAPGRGRGGAGTDLFPALPPAKKPQTTIMSYGSGRLVRGDAGRVAGNFTWGGASNAEASGSGSGSGSGAADGAGGNGDGEVEEGKTRKKGNKGKKVLVSWG